ncbi:MAG: hypothetical protein JWN93_2105 [Hyphomicrobiales bacterium]|nr:hypothetical protein [Hyphomicrobiales bacterium]
MTNQSQPQTTPTPPSLVAALVRLAPRARQVVITGVILILLGSGVMAFLGLSRVVSLVPVALAMGLAALLELGVGHHARTPGKGTPWDVAGALLALAAVLTAASPLLYSTLYSTLCGLALMGAGWARLRATTLMPLQHKSAIVPISSSATILIGVLILTRWPGDNVSVIGSLLAVELVATGWGLVGFGLTLKRTAGS